ncbi:hypothetical protein [Thalassolituus oleivorans]|nr:hypothetical protein [Thalassolituus oleivorans]|tara:strand:- start:1280 stop:1402 length:123 start_codon:yes stop_codon:yes gene_type:complete
MLKLGLIGWLCLVKPNKDSNKNTKPEWLRRLDDGNDFNKA